MEFSRPEYWSGYSQFPSPGDLPNPGTDDNPLQYSCLEKPMDGGAGGLQSTGLQRVGYD